MAKNYYLVLGVSPDASPSEIKSAYRRRVREFHPDRFGEGRQPFLDIQEAYSALSDAAQRSAHDRSLRQARAFRADRGPYGVPPAEPLRRPRPGAEALKPEQEGPADLGRAFLSRSFNTYRPSHEELFDRLWRNFSRTDAWKTGSVRQLVVEFVLTPNEARRGGNVRIHVPARIWCPACRGRGSIGYYDCGRCAGEGAMTGEFPIMLAYPAGIRDGYQVSIRLDRLGIRNLFLTACFRVGAGRDAI